MIRQLSLIVTVILLAGCTSNNFVRLDPAEIKLGVSDKKAVIDAVGNPERKSIHYNTYRYSVPIEEVTHKFIKVDKSTGDLAYFYREQTLLFYQDTLVGYTFVSGLPRESTFFDIRKARLIKPGETKMDQVIDLLGPPAGERIPPATCDNSVKDLIYKLYYDLKVNVDQNYKFNYASISKKSLQLVVQFGNDGAVIRLTAGDDCTE